MNFKEQKILKLTALWYKIVGLGHHKDRDCHWEIDKIWSYGQKSRYIVVHNGYCYQNVNREFETYEKAQNYLTSELKAAIRREQKRAKYRLENPSSESQYDLEQDKQILEMIEEANVL